MKDIFRKIKENLYNGTLFTKGGKFLRNRTVKFFKYGNFFYLLDVERIRTKEYQKTIPKNDFNHYVVGNYYLDKRIVLDENSIVYSLGVLNNIEFDLSISKKFGCRVFMYDPSPVSIEFMKKKESDTLLKYKPVGVWTERTKLRFYEPKYGGSASALFKDRAENLQNYFEADCFTMNDLMIENKHVEIDVFKADIEGAALPIMEQMIENNIFPTQIVVEFERPRNNKKEVDDYFSRVTRIRNQLKEKGYEEYLLPRKASKYYSLELLFVNQK